MLRGFAAALLSFLTSSTSSAGLDARPALVQEARAVVSDLNNIRFSDIAPPDLEAEQHAREHFEAEGAARDEEVVRNEELQLKRDVEGLEDMMKGLSAGSVQPAQVSQRPTREDVTKLVARLRALSSALDVSFPAGLSPN